VSFCSNGKYCIAIAGKANIGFNIDAEEQDRLEPLDD
jgi:hypothetical protein